MVELWDIYDINRKKIGKYAERGVYEFKPGEYHIVVNALIMNSKNQILISKRAEFKPFGLMWECNGGSILKGESSLQGMIREIKEELGIEFQEKDGILFKEIRRDETTIPNFKDVWLFKKDIDCKDIKFPDGESIEAKWVDINKFLEMEKNKEIVPSFEMNMNEFNRAVKLLEEL